VCVQQLLALPLASGTQGLNLVGVLGLFCCLGTVECGFEDF